ncbi:hypothetical protein SLS60_011034 [Paraconiothyrium brasiliense]|uniref:DUF6590 domain-containing protein n=1 Tax=Paraconiothyrium brasiliense TaxID=300254 RepID=A0ABR3QKM2_9PLEO
MRGQKPQLLPGEYEAGLTKRPIRIDPADSSITLELASRLHYAKAYPIEMNVKVNDIGNVAPEDLQALMMYYQEENALQTHPYSSSGFSPAVNPKGFFKKGRVFTTLDAQTFAVVRPQNGYSLCLAIDGPGTLDSDASAGGHAAVVPLGQQPPDDLVAKPIYIKVEDQSAAGSLDAMARVNFSQVHQINENVQMRNLGRVVPESIHQMEQYLNWTN